MICASNLLGMPVTLVRDSTTYAMNQDGKTGYVAAIAPVVPSAGGSTFMFLVVFPGSGVYAVGPNEIVPSANFLPSMTPATTAHAAPVQVADHP